MVITKILETDISTDVVVIGGGIAGVTTLYYLLKNTNKKIILIEANQLAHGATGHNAGQIVAEFERSLESVIAEHGIKKSIQGFQLVEDAWELLSEILQDTKIDVPFKEFIGYGGFARLEQLMPDLKTELIKNRHGLVAFPVLIARSSGWMTQIPKEYHELCTEVDDSIIKKSLEVTTDEYLAALPGKKATMNSALFTERLAEWCLKQFPDRVQLFEHSFVHGIELAGRPSILTERVVVTCDQVVLCTNGFDRFYIHDKNGLEIDTKFHHLVEGVVGYMTGFLSKNEIDPMANYFYHKAMKEDDPYFYVTQRKFAETSSDYLMAIGGPEIALQEREIYFSEYDVANNFKDESIAFAQNHFDMNHFEHKFFWHGLMGYTRTKLRLVGPEPQDLDLLYNLGCNGIGILPSIMGAHKIAQHINNEPMEETIFDPKR
jgi:glycine/D-amino acid oxidase-like deaminating enzyme